MNAMQITKKAMRQFPSMRADATHWLYAHRKPVLATAGVVSVSGLAGYLLYRNSGKIRQFFAQRKKKASSDQQHKGQSQATHH